MSNNIAKNTESNKLESKKDSKNKDEVRLDENGDEIMYEVRYKLNIKDTIQYFIMLMFGILAIYCGIEDFLSNEIDVVLFIMILLIFGIPFNSLGLYSLFYMRKNRFYVTNSGIGFERRKWFRMQKGFFKFGEVGVAMRHLTPLHFDSSIEIFTFCPINFTIKPMALARLRDKNYKHYIFCEVLTRFYRDDNIAIFNFIRQKTKEALESQGIHISDSELKDKIKDLIYKDI